MGEAFKTENREYDIPKIAMGLAMAILVIMQQYQTMHIAEIRTMAEVNRANFMDKDEVMEEVEKGMERYRKLNDRLAKIEAEVFKDEHK